MKKITISFYIYFSFLQTYADLQADMLPNTHTVGVSGDGTETLTNVLVSFKTFLFSILALVAVGVFLYFGFNLIINRGNEEEFKKTLMGFMYAIIGLAIIPLSWGVVKIVTTLTF